MWFIPVLIVCSVSLGSEAEACVRFQDRPVVRYMTFDQCSGRLREFLESVKSNTPKLNILVPGAWSYEGRCEVPVISEVSG